MERSVRPAPAGSRAALRIRSHRPYAAAAFVKALVPRASRDCEQPVTIQDLSGGVIVVRGGFGERAGAPVAQRLGDVAAQDAGSAFEIGEGARDPQHAVIAARRQPQPFGGAHQQVAPAALGRRDLVEQRAVGLGVGPDPAVRQQRRLGRL